MAVVSITWSETNGGSAITSFNHGNAANGTIATIKTLYIRHDGTNALTNCKFYLSGADVAEVLAWGDEAVLGGMQIHMNATGLFPVADWPTAINKSPSGKFTHTFRTGFGDSLTNALMLRKAMGCVNDGTIQAGASPDIRFQIRIAVPSTEDSTGARSVDQVLRFTYTS